MKHGFFAGEGTRYLQFAVPRLALLVCFLLVCAVGISGCSLGKKTPPASSSGGGGGGGGKAKRGTKAYTINGKTYQPLLSAHGFTEDGIASWYGKDFHGKLTANGENYDMYGMTAAHKLLPFNTQVRVTNKNNGRSVIVRINDRGPFVANRVIDLTNTAADGIGMLGPGTAPVLLETVGEVPGMTASGELSGSFFVQVGAFGTKSNADNLVKRMKGQGIDARAVYSDALTFWRVQAGPYSSVKKAEQAVIDLSSQFPRGFVVAE